MEFNQKFLKIFMRRHLGDLKDWLNSFKRNSLTGVPRYGLSSIQVYPTGKNIDRLLNISVSERMKELSLEKGKNMASIGTCFSE